MKRRASVLVLFTTMAFAVAVLVFTPAGQAVANTMRPLLVQVVNDGTSPVPVTGTTSISGTADVNVANQPTVNAHILSGSFVGIDPANNTVQVASSAGTPVQVALGIAVGSAGPSPLPSSYTVATDKRLILEFVSGGCVRSSTDSRLAEVKLVTTAGGVIARHGLPFTSVTDSFTGFTHHAFAETTKIHADPGSEVLMTLVGGANPAGFLDCFMTISGSLVNP